VSKVVFGVLIISASILQTPDLTAGQLSKASGGFANLPLYFEANEGQADNPARFIARNSQGIFYLGPNEVVITLRDSNTGHAQSLEARDFSRKSLRFQFIGGCAQARMTGAGQLRGEVNYLIGSDPSKWRKGVPTFASVEVAEAYPGINLILYGNQRQLEYDFVVGPGVDPAAIAIQVEGTEQMQIDERGDLLLKVGENVIRQKRPILYQMQEGRKREIEGRYKLRDSNIIAFEIGSYDPALPLIIDPVLAYSTFIGGLAAEAGRAIALDKSGNIFIAGDTLSTQLGTDNAFQPAYAGGYPGAGGDAFVAKFDPTGTNLLFLTYLGGNGDDSAAAIANDSEGNVYVTGVTDSTNFPIPSLTVSNRISGKGELYFDLHPYDAFVAKISADGSRLIYATYLGGKEMDQGLGIAVDSNFCAYVAGFTESPNFPTTPGAFQPDFQGKTDAFVTKIASNGMSFSYSTFLGGTNIDKGNNITVDSLGRAFVTGSTSSTNFPVSPNAFQTLGPTNLVSQAFVSILATDGSSVERSTLIGAVGTTSGFAIVLDGAGNPYVAGSETGSGFPVTPSAINPGGIFKSTDGAANWVPSNLGLLYNQVNAIGIDPVNPANIYVGTGRGIARTTNSGATWQVSLDSFDEIVAFAINPLEPATLYAGSTQVLKSTNSGVSWFSSSKGLEKPAKGSTNILFTINKLAIDPISPETLYAGTESGVFKTSDSTETWRSINSGLGEIAINDLILDPSNPATLYVATSSGVFRSTNGGSQWKTYNDGLTNLTANALAADSITPTSFYLGMADGKVFKRTQAGTNWILLDTRLIDTNSFFSNSVPLQSITGLAVDPLTPTTLYAGTRGGLFKSVDGGTNWSIFANGLPGLPIAAFAIDPKSPSTLYVGTFNNFAGTEAFLTKFNPELTSVIFSATIGGSGADQAVGLAVDGAGNAYIAGPTTSPDFPTVLPIGYPNSFNSGLNDAFVTAIKSDGSDFLYSTYLGGSGNDFANGIALDLEANAWIVGQTFSTDFPTTTAPQSFAGPSEAFIAKISAASSLVDVTFQTVPSGIPLYVDGATNATPITFHWPLGSFHSIAATPQSAGTNAQYAWLSWSDGGNLFHNITASGNTNIVANFKLQYFLTMTSTNITVTPTNPVFNVTNSGALMPLSGWYDAGTNLTISAIAPEMDTFDGWIGTGDGAFTGTNNPATLILNGPIVETALFNGPLTNRIKVVITGDGKVSPNLDGDSLKNGKSYTMTATPGPGYVFAAWSGAGFRFPSPKITFVMTNGLVLKAEFIPTPFGSFGGNYAGLFYDTNVLAFESSGFFTATVTTQGVVSAKLQMRGKTFPFSGQFTSEGMLAATVVRPNLSSLLVTLEVDLSSANDKLTGRISSGIWTADLVANRAVYSKTNPPPEAGKKYTIAFPGPPDSLTEPGGDGFGTVVIDNSGTLTFSGKLADGTAVSQKTFLSKQNQWPFYVSLYSGNGLITGWLTITNLPDRDIAGTVGWLKLPRPFTDFYVSGFTIQSEVTGSLYSFTNGVPVLPLNQGQGRVILENGTLTQNVTNVFVLDSANKVSSADKLRLTITTSSGLFSGTTTDPATGTSISFKGVVLQKQNRGSGFFRLADQAGRVILEPEF